MFLLLIGCIQSEDTPEEAAPIPGNCPKPYDGRNRFKDVAVEWGLGAAQSSADVFTDFEGLPHGGGGLSEDLDQDGDFDLLVMRYDGGPDLYRNEGDQFTFLGNLGPLADTPVAIQPALVDMDTDGWLDIVQIAPGKIWVYRNLGAMEFSEAELWYLEDDPNSTAYMSVSAADLDGDQDMDLALATLQGFQDIAYGHDQGTVGRPEIVLKNEGGSLSHWMMLHHDGGTLDLVTYFTDADQDGDMDLWMLADMERKSAFFRNEAGVLVDETDKHPQMVAAFMGIDSADLNGDGTMDYCMTDTGLPRCFGGDGAGSFFEIGNALGLSSELPSLGWSVDLEDLDNDGDYELYQAGAPASPADGSPPNLIWWHEETGFVDVTEELDFGDTSYFYGVITADFNNDGWLDIYVGGPEKIPHFYQNQCGSNHWIEVAVAGPPGNPTGFGLWVTVEAGGKKWLREVRGSRAQSQGPGTLHFGLGAATKVDRITVWGSEGEQELTDLAVNQRYTIPYP